MTAPRKGEPFRSQPAKVETYSRSAEYAATALGKKGRTTSSERAEFTRAVQTGAFEMRDYLLAKLK